MTIVCNNYTCRSMPVMFRIHAGTTTPYTTKCIWHKTVCTCYTTISLGQLSCFCQAHGTVSCCSQVFLILMTSLWAFSLQSESLCTDVRDNSSWNSRTPFEQSRYFDLQFLCDCFLISVPTQKQTNKHQTFKQVLSNNNDNNNKSI